MCEILLMELEGKYTLTDYFWLLNYFVLLNLDFL